MRLHQDLLASLGWCLSAMNILSFFCILVICGRSFSQEQTYVVSAPKILRVGSFEKVVIQAFGYENEFSVNVAIKSYPDKQTVYSSGRVSLSSANKFQGSVTLMIQPKDLPGPGSSVHVYLEASSVHFTREKKMPVTYDNGYLFIQTDKPIYTPDQSVKVRVYSLNQELKPAQRETVLTFVDPEGVKVDIIEEHDFTGIVSFPDFKIPSNPKYGTWKIEAKYKKSFTTTAFTNFEVKEYAMPSFSVSIEPEYNFISFEKFEKFKITIQASYFYNKVVAHAEVFVRFGIIEANEKTMMPKAMHVTEMRNGVAEVNFNSSNAVRDIGRQSLEELNGAYLYIAASVLESEGGHGEEAEFYGVKFVLSPYKLNLVATPLFVKPGLPFSIKVQVKDTLNQPVGNLPVTLTANAVNEQMDSTHLVSGASESGRRQTSRTDGTALFIVNVPSDSKTLEFQVKTVDPSLSEENQATEHYEATAYSSLSKSYLYIDWASNHKMLHVGDHISINVYPSSHYIHKIYYYSYLILSKGKIISFGTQARINDTDYEHVSFQLTQDMVPSARLLVYYIVTGENTAELVADSVWLNIEQKCGNSLEIKLSSRQESYKPGKNIPFYMKTQFSSFITLSSMDKAIYGVTGTRKRSMERVMLELEKSDLGCGAGGGQNNVNVFRLAGLTFLTNANADDSKEADEICAAIVRSKRFDFEEEIVKRASLYAIEAVRQCCMDGVRAYPVTETCAERTKRVQGGPKCLYAFKDCCEYANKLRQQEPNKVLMLARKQFEAFLELDKPEVRSYFPESWLWEVHQVPQGSKSLPVILPDSLTTWEIQGVSISDKGICVADPLEVQVFKDVFLSMHIPYSVVRGEQIALKGSVYNYGTSTVKFCVKVAAGEGICLFGESSTGPQRIWGCKFSNIESSSISSVTVRLLPLELGLHTINFTLYTGRDSEILVKTLRVVPEGIKKELNAGFTLDPKGVYGSVRRRQDFRYRVPFNVVPKMKIDRTVSVKGQLMGEVISAVLKPEGVDFLTNLPKGSAEAELMSIVPVFYVYHYLEKTSNWDLLGTEILTAEVKMKRKMKEGIVSILSFRNKDFSYSMWKDRKPSTWLTAFALRIFGQVSAYIDLDHISVCNSLVWLTDHCQMSDGSFKELSSYQPVKLQGTLPKEAEEKALYLTAFTVIGIDKSVHMCPVQRLQDAKLKAEEYLLKNVQAAQSTFTLAITCYALALMDLNHPGTRLAFGKLKKEAFTKGEPPIYRFWKDTLKSLDTFTPNAGTAQMVETTAYALLTTLKGGDKIYANPVIRWLSEEQRFGGGFYSTQDTINALEALTEYSILAKHLSLDMNVKVAYKNHGDLHLYKLTEQNFIGRPVTVPLDEDIYVSTTGNTGLATVNVRTVYHTISTSDEICNFELTITPETEQDKRRQEGEIPQRLKACAKYKPGAREPRSESAHAVMDISLPSGVEADEEDLYVLAAGVDQLIRSYEIKDGHIIIQIDSVPANKFFCVAFRINEIFRVGMLSPATFTVYEYHAPDKKCTIFYNPYGDDRLVKLCEGNECKCMEAECSQMRKKLDLSVSADTRKEVACQQDIAYVYKVKILSYKEEGSFIKYTATLLDVYKRGGALAQKNDEITFVKKNTCFDVVLNPGEQYLIMGKEALRIVVGFSFKYQYPLDSKTWIEWWPSNTACPSCKQFVATMEGFVEDLLIFGC
ncbi:PREDICTED: complement C5 isoform X1 [Crocodylus porosus]|uniref:complement C5 isoform X1 n=1 Tax=Crocodylus porosus TaxID=8502 RepID=UPI00093E42A3|nr:PREDICTED: complement C5 isoform X1 [Crocodylus porosus]